VIAPQRKHRTYPVLLPEEAAPKTPARPRRTHPVARGLAVMVLVATPLLGHVWLESQAAQAGYRLHVLRAQVARLERERDVLRTQVASLRRPQRLERLASRMGLQPPDPNQLAAVWLPTALATAPAAPGAPWWQQVARLLSEAVASAAERNRP